MKLFSFLKKKKTTRVSAKSFFNLSGKDKKKVLLRAAQLANEDQLSVVKKYAPLYLKH